MLALCFRRPMTDETATPQNREPHRANHHSLLEDAIAFVIGTMMCSFSVAILGHLGLITGQTAGLALLLSYAGGWPFGLVFFVVNLPFYVLALLRMGLRFTLKTFVAVGLVSAQMAVVPELVQFEALEPVYGAALAGIMAGAGLLILFRHGASLGGIGVLALLLQEKTGLQAGWTQLIVDALIFIAAFTVIAPDLVALSLFGAVLTNVAIAMNHRRDRYTAT